MLPTDEGRKKGDRLSKYFQTRLYRGLPRVFLPLEVLAGLPPLVEKMILTSRVPSIVLNTCTYMYSVLQICPPFCNLSLSKKRRGGAYTRDATISLAITPSLLIKHDLIVGGGRGPSVRHHRARGGEIPLMLQVG